MFDKETYWVSFKQIVIPKTSKDDKILKFNTITVVIKDDSNMPNSQKDRKNYIESEVKEYVSNWYTSHGWTKRKAEEDELLFKTSGKGTTTITIKGWKFEKPPCIK